MKMFIEIMHTFSISITTAATGNWQMAADVRRCQRPESTSFINTPSRKVNYMHVALVVGTIQGEHLAAAQCQGVHVQMFYIKYIYLNIVIYLHLPVSSKRGSSMSRKSRKRFFDLLSMLLDLSSHVSRLSTEAMAM